MTQMNTEQFKTDQNSVQADGLLVFLCTSVVICGENPHRPCACVCPNSADAGPRLIRRCQRHRRLLHAVGVSDRFENAPQLVLKMRTDIDTLACIPLA